MIREGETEIGCEVNTRNGYGFTPLAVAAAAGDASMVALLLERRADASLASLNRAELPIHHAATYQHAVVAQLLVEPTRKAGFIDARTCTGWTPLHLCCSSGDAMILKILLKARADLDTRNPQTGNEHALHCAARSNNLDIIEILLAAGADVNCTDSLSRTPLHLSATNCSPDGVSLLLRSRSDPLHRGGPRHQTPIECVPAHYSDEIAREKVLRLLNSYSRPPPQAFRVDTRFDVRDSRSLI
jgi:ankyrin repeat protein